MVDGFPTVAATDAMSSGCLLVSANPGRDYRILEPGIHYAECEPEPGAILRVAVAYATSLVAAGRLLAWQPPPCWCSWSGSRPRGAPSTLLGTCTGTGGCRCSTIGSRS